MCFTKNATAEVSTMIQKYLEKKKNQQGGLPIQDPNSSGQMMIHGYSETELLLLSRNPRKALISLKKDSSLREIAHEMSTLYRSRGICIKTFGIAIVFMGEDSAYTPLLPFLFARW